MVNSGSLDRRIAIERYGITYNDHNEPIEGWAALAMVWASVQYVSDGEKIRAAAVGATISVRILIRYSSIAAEVNPKDRVAYDGKVFDIVGVKEIGRREGLEISAAARADE